MAQWVGHCLGHGGNRRGLILPLPVPDAGEAAHLSDLPPKFVRRQSFRTTVGMDQRRVPPSDWSSQGVQLVLQAGFVIGYIAQIIDTVVTYTGYMTQPLIVEGGVAFSR